MTPKETENLWSQLDEIVNSEVPPPKISIVDIQVSRQRTPAERLAGWFLNGAAPIFLTLLVFIFFHLSAVSPIEVMRLLVLSTGLTWLFSSFLGSFPSTSPGRSTAVCVLALTVSSLLLWPSFVLFNDRTLLSSPPPDHGFMIQKSLEESAQLSVVGPTLLTLLFGLLFAYWSQARFPWLLLKAERSRVRIGLALTFLLGPALLATGYLSFLHWQSAHLTWTQAAQLHDPLKDIAESSEVYRLGAFENLKDLPWQERTATARNLSQQELTDGLKSVLNTISDPDYIPSRSEQSVLASLASRVRLKGEPTKESAAFSLQLLKLNNKTKGEMESQDLPWLIVEHTIQIMLAGDAEELRGWREEIESIQPFRPQLRDFDALVHLREPEAFLGWLSRIALNECYKVRKKTRYTEELKGEGRGASSQSGVMMDIKAALSTLSTKERNVVILREYVGLSYEEIAIAVGAPVGTVRSRLFKARERLQSER